MAQSSSRCVPHHPHSRLRRGGLVLLLPLLIGLSLILSTAAQKSSPFPSGPEKQDRIHFFFHDILSGSNPTAIQVVAPPPNAPVGFGSVVMVDNPLTETADRSSKLVGRAQGLYASASQSDVSLLMTMNYVFLDGKFNGSTLAILGRNPVMEAVREMPVVGGSGRLRMARGYAEAQTRSLGPGGDAVVEYNVYVVYNDNPGDGQVSTTVPGGGAAGGGGTGAGVGGTGTGTRTGSGAPLFPTSSWFVASAALAVSWMLSALTGA